MYLGNLYPARLPPEAAWGDFRSGLAARAGDFCLCLPFPFPSLPLSPNPQSSGGKRGNRFRNIGRGKPGERLARGGWVESWQCERNLNLVTRRRRRPPKASPNTYRSPHVCCSNLFCVGSWLFKFICLYSKSSSFE